MSTSVRVPSCSLVGTTKFTRCRGATPIPANRNFKPSKGFNSHHTLRRAARNRTSIDRCRLGTAYLSSILIRVKNLESYTDERDKIDTLTTSQRQTEPKESCERTHPSR